MPATNKILPGQTLADAVALQLGGMEAWIKTAILNDVGITDDIDAGTEIIYPSVPFNKRPKGQPLPKRTDIVRSVSAENGQSLFDMTIQECGSMSELFVFAILNGLGITDDILGLELQPGSVISQKVVRILKELKPASIGYENTIASGIGAMQIENDFKVS